jgi:hypothetical protein
MDMVTCHKYMYLRPWQLECHKSLAPVTQNAIADSRDTQRKGLAHKNTKLRRAFENNLFHFVWKHNGVY